MISDETFPVELLFDELYVCKTNGNFGGGGGASSGTFESSVFSSENMTNTTTDCSSSSKSFANQEISPCFGEPLQETPFSSFDTATNSRLILISKEPIKKKKSHSCHDLMTKKNYDHVESKVKKIIEGMNEEDRRRKQLSRHKSMPISVSPQIDDVFIHEKDPIVLLKELRRKSMKIYDLEEKCDDKDDRIYALEIERSKMRMTFDGLRLELHDLKNKEKEYKLMLAASPPQRKVVRHVLTQTDDSQTHHHRYLNPAIRELTYYSEGNLHAINLSHFSDMNNTSSENLLPLPEISMEEMNATQTIEQVIETAVDTADATEQCKKPKKLRGFFKLISCVSKQ